MLENIHKVVYINLNRRIDRRSVVEHELSMFGSKVIRFPAIEDYLGSVGCTKSHIQVLEMAIQEKWPNVLIVEDDIQFVNQDSGWPKLKTLLEMPDWKVIVLGATHKTVDGDRLIEGSSTAAQIVKQDYYECLLQNFQEGLCLLEKSKDSQFCIDQHWKQLQKRHLWQIVQPTLIIQIPSQSDTERRFTDYRSVQ